MTYYLPLADGKFASFEDTVPRATAHGRVWDYDNPAPPPPPVDKPYTAFGAGIDRTQALGYSALEGLGRATGLEGMADWARGGVESNLAAAAKGLPQEQQQSFSDANSLTDYLKATGQAISSTALPTAIGIAGGLAGGALAGPGGALAGALAGGTAAQLPLSYGQHRLTQQEVNPGQPVNEGAAFLTAVPSAAADALVNRFMFGIGKAAGISAKAVGATLLPRVAKGIGVGMVSEVPAEVFQEVLDRAQSGQELLSPDAMAAYKESALGAAAVGGVLGGGYAGALGRRPAAPGTRGEDEELRGALTAEGGTRPPAPPAPPAPTVLVAGGTFNEPGVTTVPLKEFTDWAILESPREMTTAVDAELTAHRTATGDPNAVLTPEAIRTVQEATAVKIAAEKMVAAGAAERAAAVGTARKNLADILTATKTGSLAERMAANGKVSAAEAALETAIAAEFNTPEAKRNMREAFDLAYRQGARAAPDNPDLRTAATTEGPPRILLNPEFAEGRLSGGEVVIGLSEPGPDGAITAYVMRQVEGAASGVTEEVAVDTTESNLYRMGMRAGSESPSDARATQDLAAKVMPPPPVGVGSDIQPRDATARVGSYPLEDDAGGGVSSIPPTSEPPPPFNRGAYVPPPVVETAPAPVAPPLTLAEQIVVNARKKADAAPAEGVAPLTPAQRRAAQDAAVAQADQDLARGPITTPAAVFTPAPTATANPAPADMATPRKAARATRGGQAPASGPITTPAPLAPPPTADPARAKMAFQAFIAARNLFWDAQEVSRKAETKLAALVNKGAAPAKVTAAQKKVAGAREIEVDAKKVHDAAENKYTVLRDAAAPTPGGAQASTRGSAAGSPPATTATADPAAAEATALAARRAKAFEVIKDRLEKMRARGAQGAILADNLEAELKSGVLTPAELYVAFQASSVMAIQLPAGANHDIKFVPRILVSEVSSGALAASGGTGGLTLAGTRKAPTAAGLRGLIKLSLEPQFADFMQETAAHEAFHVVQDYIASYDQSAARQIDRDFRDGMSLADVEKTLRRKLELARAPAGKSYWAELQKAFGTKTFSSGEMQALVFGALTDANRRGVPMPGIKPPYTRLVLALRQFFQRLGGALRGDGFTNPADMLNLLGEGSARRFDAEESPIGKGEVQASTRAGLDPLHASAVNKVVGHQNVAPRDGILARMGRTISGAGLTSIYGNGVQYEKFWDAIIRNASNVAQPFYILQNTLNRAGKFIGGPDVARAIEQATMTDTQLDHLVKHGHLRFDPKTRDFSPVANTKGLEQILTPVGSSQDAQAVFQTYAVALRERDQRAAGNGPFFTNLTDEEIAATLQRTESARPEWKAVAADLQTFNDSLMDLLVATGLLARGQADKLKSMFYTPFFRKMALDTQAAPGQAIGTKMSSAINDPKAFLDKLEGGSDAVEPLYSSLTKNASGILRAVSKNIAMNAATDAMLAGDLAKKKDEGSANPGDRTISFYRNGVQVHYFISDPVLWATIASAPAPIRNNMAVFAATIARFTREAITSSPSFLLSNLWKGKHIAYVQEGSPLLGNTLRAVKEAYKNSDAAQAFKISTGFGTEMYGASSADYGKLLARRIRLADGTSDLGDKIANVWGYVQRVSTATELAERLLLREHLMAEGKTAKDAAWQAYLMAPFARGGAGGGLVGSVLVGLMPYVPFLNAKVQGLTRLGQIAADSGGGQKALGVLTSRAITAVAMRGAMLGVFSMAAAMLAQSEEPEKWERETTERRTNNDIFYIGGRTIYLPRAFEVGFVFGAVPVMIFDALRKGSTEGLAKAFGMGMLNTFGFTALPAPAVIAPLASTVMNLDFLRFAPLTNANLQAKAPEDRFTPTTSGIAKLIGSLPGAGAVGLTPINTQVLLEGYLGTTGTMAINFLSDLGSKVGSPVERPSGAFGSPESIPGLAATLAGFNRFVKTDTQKADKFVTDFHEISRELQQVVRAIHDAQKIGDVARVRQVYEDSRPLLGAKTAITRTADPMSELSSLIAQVRQDTRLTTQQKDDRLYNLMSARTTMAQMAVTALRKAGL